MFPRKLDQENKEVNVPVRAIGSQVRVESLEELQERSIPISPTQKPAEGEGEVTSPNPSKPDYYAHTPPRVCQGTPIRPTQPEVIYEREPRRTTRYPMDQGLMMKGEDNDRRIHSPPMQRIEEPLCPNISSKIKHYATNRGCYTCGGEGHYATN